MAVLDATARSRTAAQYQRDLRSDAGFTKPQLVAALAAADDWAEANTANYVTALPTGFRNNSTAAQKAELLAYVLMRRVGRLRAQED